MVIMDECDRRTYIKMNGKRMQCGKMRKVKYGDVIRLITKYVRGSGSIRLSKVCDSLEGYLGVTIDVGRVKEMMGERVVTKLVVNGDVVVMEDWVVS